jgi:hypothetical protein
MLASVDPAPVGIAARRRNLRSQPPPRAERADAQPDVQRDPADVGDAPLRPSATHDDAERLRDREHVIDRGADLMNDARYLVDRLVPEIELRVVAAQPQRTVAVPAEPSPACARQYPFTPPRMTIYRSFDRDLRHTG